MFTHLSDFDELLTKHKSSQLDKTGLNEANTHTLHSVEIRMKSFIFVFVLGTCAQAWRWPWESKPEGEYIKIVSFNFLLFVITVFQASKTDGELARSALKIEHQNSWLWMTITLPYRPLVKPSNISMVKRNTNRCIPTQS